MCKMHLYNAQIQSARGERRRDDICTHVFAADVQLRNNIL